MILINASAKIQREDEQASDSEDDDLSTSRLQHDLDGTTHRCSMLALFEIANEINEHGYTC